MNLKDIPDRFWGYVDLNGPTPAHLPGLGRCWLWIGTLKYSTKIGKDKAYGKYFCSGRYVSAHRLMYQTAHEHSITSKIDVDHMCHNRLCVNPNHLQAVSRSHNCQNRQGANKGSKTGVWGVYPHGNKFRVNVMVRGVNYGDKGFSTVEEASEYAKRLRQELFDNNLVERT